MRLPDPGRSRTVLIGTSTYRSEELPDLPAVRNNLADLAATLTDPQFGAIPRERCTVVADPADPRSVYRALRTAADSTEDTLLVYFAGHGRTGTRNELYLGLTDTDPDELRVSALPFDLVREVLSDSPAANRVVILDCCFSGRAVQDMAGAEETILGQIGVEGTYVLASAPANAVSLAPLGALPPLAAHHHRARAAGTTAAWYRHGRPPRPDPKPRRSHGGLCRCSAGLDRRLGAPLRRPSPAWPPRSCKR